MLKPCLQWLASLQKFLFRGIGLTARRREWWGHSRPTLSGVSLDQSWLKNKGNTKTHKNHLIVESNHMFVSKKWQKSVTCAAFHQKECEEQIKNRRRCSWSETWICVCLDSWGAESSVKNLIHTGPAAKRIFILYRSSDTTLQHPQHPSYVWYVTRLILVVVRRRDSIRLILSLTFTQTMLLWLSRQ